MKKIIVPFFCAVLFSTSAVAQKTSTATVKSAASTSQVTPKQVIDNYIAALGGKEKLMAVKSTVIENVISAQGMEIKSTTKKMGNKFKSIQNVMGQEVTQVFDGEKGYLNQMGTKTEFPADKLPELKKSQTIDALGYDAASFQTVNVEKIDSKDYHVLSSDKGKFYFDAATGLLYKAASPQGDAVMKNYMTVDGIKFPELIEAEGGGQKVSIKTTKITLNSGVSDADFN
ncbi:hypothetical protein CHRY9390_02215 [Chryseobacterium aquaeductus]|uniref:Uncharacterized protein n=1 Tax=Chryseobacterium aquaeductus TaxID=2675056 RepID=A0A9N8QV44_9FLAO|nr:hypothetical protein [Chryseobacterium aquaeductus]CAA7331513.1 hypothetical protein CHRY9390_02215 [Chryseobacterium potabilaquae]CAD7810653.1 hypothetical protein CHRY9390_02215 [Chryseobacterium aquaeductus]